MAEFFTAPVWAILQLREASAAELWTPHWSLEIRPMPLCVPRHVDTDAIVVADEGRRNLYRPVKSLRFPRSAEALLKVFASHRLGVDGAYPSWVTFACRD